MTKRETAVRLLNILAIVAYLAFYIEGSVFQQAGFYIAVLYILFLILKPFMLRQPYSAPFNYVLEFADMAFVICISIFVTDKAFLPLTLFTLLRCAILFPVYFVLLSFAIASVFVMVSYSVNGATEAFDIGIQLLLVVLPSCIVCLIKNDVLAIDSRNRELSEKVRINKTIIEELQKYSDTPFVGDNRKENEMIRTDYVTQIPNRYYFEEMLRSGLKKTREPSFNMGVMMVYIDNLYQYRVKYSYSTEHILVKRINDLISEQVKSNDFIARYEEDCIAVLLFNKDVVNAEGIARVVYSNFEALKYNEPELADISLKILVNDIEHSLKEDMVTVDTMKLLNRGKVVDFIAGDGIKEK